MLPDHIAPEHDMFLADYEGCSATQVLIYYHRLLGNTYCSIQEHHKIKFPSSLVTCLQRTAKRLYWDIGYQGGCDSYLSNVDEIMLVDMFLMQKKTWSATLPIM